MEVRAAIDEVDAAIAGLVSRRAALVREAAGSKSIAGLPARDEAREREIADGYAANARPVPAELARRLAASVLAATRHNSGHEEREGRDDRGAGAEREERRSQAVRGA